MITFRNETLVGWIANPTQPERLEPVICTSGDGAKMVVYPFIPRQDVRDTPGNTGRFGFAIPLAILEGMDIVSLSSADGIGLHGGQAIPLPANKHQPKLEGSRLVFLHIRRKPAPACAPR